MIRSALVVALLLAPPECMPAAPVTHESLPVPVSADAGGAVCNCDQIASAAGQLAGTDAQPCGEFHFTVQPAAGFDAGVTCALDADAAGHRFALIVWKMGVDAMQCEAYGRGTSGAFALSGSTVLVHSNVNTLQRQTCSGFTRTPMCSTCAATDSYAGVETLGCLDAGAPQPVCH